MLLIPRAPTVSRNPITASAQDQLLQCSRDPQQALCVQAAVLQMSDPTRAGRPQGMPALPCLWWCAVSPAGPHVLRFCCSVSSCASPSSMGVFHQMGPPNLPSPLAQLTQPVWTSGVTRCWAARRRSGTLTGSSGAVDRSD